MYYTQISDEEADLLSKRWIAQTIHKAIQIATGKYINMSVRRNRGENDDINYLELDMDISISITLVYTIINDYLLALTSLKH